MDTTILILEGILFIAIVNLIIQFNRNRVFSKAVGTVLNKTELEYEKRNFEKEEKRIREGNFEEKKFISKLDRLIECSGVRSKFKFLSAEVYLLLNILLIGIGFCTGYFVFGFWLWGLLISVSLVLIFYGVLVFLENRNYKKIDKEMITLLNLMQNFSATEDDIVQIIKNTSKIIKEPLKGYLTEFCDETEKTGNTTRAFRNLEYRIPNEKLSSFIRNIEICSRHEANYREIIEDATEGIRDYLAGKEERKAIRQNGQIEKFTCVLISLFVLIIYDKMIDNLFYILKSSFIGNIILLYNSILLIALIWSFIAPEER